MEIQEMDDEDHYHTEENDVDSDDCTGRMLHANILGFMNRKFEMKSTGRRSEPFVPVRFLATPTECALQALHSKLNVLLKDCRSYRGVLEGAAAQILEPTLFASVTLELCLHILVSNDHFYTCNLGGENDYEKWPEFGEVQAVVSDFYEIYSKAPLTNGPAALKYFLEELCAKAPAEVVEQVVTQNSQDMPGSGEFLSHMPTHC